MNEEAIILTEENVIDIFKKLSNQQTVSVEEIERVKARFKELVNAQM